jgi:hypothetical protein
MTCTITLDPVIGLAPDASGTPASLRIRGSMSGACQQLFVQLGGQPGVLAPVSGGQFEATLLLGQHYQPGDVQCGADNDGLLSLMCVSGDACQHQERVGQLDCSGCTLAFAVSNPVTGIAGTLTDTPVQVVVRGIASGCDAVQVRFAYGPGMHAQTAWKDAIMDGDGWEATFVYDPAGGTQDDYEKDVTCGQRIAVEARCAGGGCETSAEFVVVCRESEDCPAAELAAVVTKECRNQRRVVVFTVSLSGVTGATAVTGHLHTGDDSIGLPILIPVEYSAATAGNWSGSNGTVQRSFEHTYPAGTYEATLVLVGTCAGETAARPIRDGDGNPLDALEVPACECETATIAVRACHVTDPRLTCADNIPDEACEPLEDAEDENGNLPAGVYLLTAETEPPNAGPISWTVNGALQVGATGSRFCVTLGEGQTLDVYATTNLGLLCGAAADHVTLVGAPAGDGDGGDGGDGDDDGGGDDDEVIVPPDDGDGDDDDDDDDDVILPPEDGCLLNWCKIWLLINIALAFLGGAAIIITACLLFNPASISNAFWVGVIISIVLVVVSVISFIAWGAVCGRLRRMCGAGVWVHDILRLLAYASGIVGAIVGAAGAWPCAIGFFLTFGYWYVLADIMMTALRVAGCELGRNGLIGLLGGVVDWMMNAVGLGGQS